MFESRINKRQNHPLLSVSVITYNHRAFIEQTLQSVIDQEVNFDLEILVGDDASLDGTQEIIKEFENNNPDLIYGIYHETNNSGIPGRVNNLTNLINCRGKYIALLDGDDFYTDKLKLQRQVDFLENNPEYSAVFERATALDIENKRVPQKEHKLFYHDEQLIEDFDYLSVYQNANSFMHTSSIVFRKESILPLENWFSRVHYADFIMELLLASKGRIKFFNNYSSIYRIHSGGVTSNSSYTDHLKKRIFDLRILNKYLEKPQPDLSFNTHLFKAYLSLYRDSIKQKNYKNSALYALELFKLDPQKFYSQLGKKLRKGVFQDPA